MEAALTTSPDDPALERRVIRKVSLRLLPLLALGFFMTQLDRANLAVLGGPMSEDLGLSASTFGIVAGVFYFGYLLFEIPSNIGLVRFGARRWLSRIMVSWGIVTIAMMFVGSDWSLIALRFLLGAAEAGFWPGALLYLTFWFPPRMLPKAFSALLMGLPPALALASVITSSLLVLDGTFGMAGWKWAFLLEGIPTVLLGVVLFFFLSDRPRNAKWLTPEERDYLEARVSNGEHGAGHSLKAVLAILRSPKTWLFAMTYFALDAGFWAITYWLPQIVGKRFEVGPVQAGLLSSLPWVLAAIAIVVVAQTSARTGDRRLHVFGCLVVAGFGLWLSTVAGSPWVALLGLGLGAAGMQAMVPLFWSQVSSVFTGAIAAVSFAAINAIGNVSGFVGPYALGFFQDRTGSTNGGLVVMAALFIVAALMSLFTSRMAIRAEQATPEPATQPQTDRTPS